MSTTQAALLEALKIAEAALADIGDADREPGDDVAWCEARAAEPLPFIRAALRAADAAQPEPVVRFCPGCGSVGPVPEKYRDCCPDGSHARLIPESLANRCRDLFKLALESAAAPPQPAPIAAQAGDDK